MLFLFSRLLFHLLRLSSKQLCYLLLVYNNYGLIHSCICDLMISNNKGGVWVLPLNLHALSASPDDTIIIEGIGLNREAHVSFQLSSPTQ